MVDGNTGDDAELIAALASLHDRGALGELSLPSAVAHSEAFLAPIPTSARRLIDLGSGGGLPGLVIAARHAEMLITLTDRRERRVDLLRLAVARLGFDSHVTVLAADVVRLGRLAAHAGRYDVVTARSFGEPAHTLRTAGLFLSTDGVVIISEPPGAGTVDRWSPDLLDAVGMSADAPGTHPFVRVFRRIA